MKILHISAECYPIAKVGGLADVVGTLPKFQKRDGHEAQVIMPFYLNSYTEGHEFSAVFEGFIWLGKEKLDFTILQPSNGELEIDVLLVRIPGLLTTDFVYSSDDSKRFLAFSIAALTWAIAQDKVPDVVHCHDHHTGLVPFMMSHCTDFSSFKETPSVLTIHNAQYQGDFDMDQVHLLPDFPMEHIGLLDWNGRINPLASAIKCAWRVTSVSPGYMQEMHQQANGLEGLISHESAKCVGIINGVDYEVWNPETDPNIPHPYKNAGPGKLANKKWLCQKFGLAEDLPLMIFIGRLVYEKGADVMARALTKVLEGKQASVLILGSGSKDLEEQLEALKASYPGYYNAFIGYDEKLAHIMYAGADFLLMPSRVEPCGLNQLYAMRYGTIPVVRSIGGLKDTVTDIADGGYGIRHESTSEKDIIEAMQRAIDLYQTPKSMTKLSKRVMALNNSWESSSEAYIHLYKSIIPKKNV